MLRSILFLVPATALFSFLPGCFSQAPDLPTKDSIVDSQSASYQVTLEIAENNDLIVSVTNNTDKPIVFAPRADFLVVYHETPDGTKTALTWDGSNAEMKLLSPFETVNLLPKSTYIIRKVIWIDRQHSIDRALELKRKGRVYASVKPLRAGQIDAIFRTEAAKWALLLQEARSNTIEVPRGT